jgi:carbon storage regulator CsrA
VLLLFRKVGETVYVDTPDGSEIKIVVIALYQNGVKLGIKAPENFNIYRAELLQELEQAREQAMGDFPEIEYKMPTVSPIIRKLAAKLKQKEQKNQSIEEGEEQ